MSPLALRRWHSYLSLIAAPSVLFFSLTGAVQLFGWHEAHGDYRPPAWLERLSSLHKDQVLESHEDKDASPPVPANPLSEHADHADHAPEQADHAGHADHHDHDDEDSTRTATWVLKIYFFAIALSLSVSTLLGAWMGLTQTPRKRLAVGLLATGMFLPLITLLF